MGRVTAATVIVTFYNFNPSLVRHAMDGVPDGIDVSSPEMARAAERPRPVWSSATSAVPSPPATPPSRSPTRTTSACGGAAASGRVLTDAGRDLRQEIEDRTDRLAAPAWAHLTDDEAAELRGLMRPWSKALFAGMSAG
jgi:hypothetical protein